MFFRKQKADYFDIQPGYEPEDVVSIHDQMLFDEALADHPQSAHQPARSFVGSVIQKKRFLFAFLGIALLMMLFVGKLGFLQIAKGEEFRGLAEQNRTRVRIIPAKRGVIYDRNGIILAKNDPTFDVVTSIKQLPENVNERQDVLLDLASELNLDVFSFLDSISATKIRNEQILLATNIEYVDAMLILSHQDRFKGIDIELRSKRSYITTDAPSLSHVLGYTGIINAEEYAQKKEEGYRGFDYLGKQGVEKYYEQKLRGTFGKEILEVNAFGSAERTVSKADPIDGENLTLAIDVNLQSYIETVLKNRMEGTAATKASVVMMDPSSGEILALVSWPSFDSNAFINGIDQTTYQTLLEDERLPLFSRAVSGEFPSGSTIKPVFAAGALIDGIITTSTSFLSVGGIRVGLWFFPDWRPGGHGPTNVYHAIADSVNTFFYMIGGGNETFQGMGVERLMEHARTFGFGEKTGIDLPGEVDGFLPSKEWKLQTKDEVWYIGDTYHVSIGQGDFLSTPLQIARSTAIFANGGHLVTPHVNKEAPIESEQIIQDEVVDIIANAMRLTVTNGSATSLQSIPVAVAGKTGTAQWSSTKPNHSWFTGFAPFENPTTTITVLIEEGGDASLAIPVTLDILNYWFAPGSQNTQNN